MVREVLQSVIESLRLRCADPVAKLTEALDAYAMAPGICIPDLLFPLPTHKALLSRRRAGKGGGDSPRVGISTPGSGDSPPMGSGEKPHMPFRQWEDPES